MLFKSLDTKYIYKRYLHNSHLESQPNIISTVLMHLLRISLFIKFKCSEAQRWRMGRKSPFNHKLVHIWHHAALQQFTLHCLALFCSASQFILHMGVHIAMFGTLHIAHCTVQHSLARPLLGQTVHLPDALKDVAFPAISGDWISLAKFVRMLARAVRLNYRRSFPLISLSLAACLST